MGERLIRELTAAEMMHVSGGYFDSIYEVDVLDPAVIPAGFTAEQLSEFYLEYDVETGEYWAELIFSSAMAPGGGTGNPGDITPPEFGGMGGGGSRSRTKVTPKQNSQTTNHSLTINLGIIKYTFQRQTTSVGGGGSGGGIGGVRITREGGVVKKK